MFLNLKNLKLMGSEIRYQNTTGRVSTI